MTGFELWISGVGSNRSTNCTTTTYRFDRSRYVLVSEIEDDNEVVEHEHRTDKRR